MEAGNAFQVQAPLCVDGVTGEYQRGSSGELYHQTVVASGVTWGGDEVNTRSDFDIPLHRHESVTVCDIRSEAQVGVAEGLERFRLVCGLELETMRDHVRVRQMLDAAAVVEVE